MSKWKEQVAAIRKIVEDAIAEIRLRPATPSPGCVQ